MSDFNDENRISMSCDPFNCFDSHDLDTYKDVEDGEMNVNLCDAPKPGGLVDNLSTRGKLVDVR